MRIYIDHYTASHGEQSEDSWVTVTTKVQNGVWSNGRIVPYSDDLLNTLINDTVESVRRRRDVRNVEAVGNIITYEMKKQAVFIEVETAEQLLDWISMNTGRETGVAYLNDKLCFIEDNS